MAIRELVDPSLVRAAWRTWGAKGLARRASYEVRGRTIGWERAERAWLERVAGAELGIRKLGLALPRVTPDTAAVRARSLYGGAVPIREVPPDWHRDPTTGHTFARSTHWSTLHDDDPWAADIRDVWELHRLSWLGAYLQRIDAGDDAGVESIWRLVEHWIATNPPYLGVGWMSGQEAALRAITLLFVAEVVRDHPLSTPERMSAVAEVAAITVGRVRPTLSYGLSQRNNHAISEAAFLWSAAQLIEGLPDAEDVGLRAAADLSEAIDDQFLPDGSYAQHSPTYQRLATHTLLWCLAVARCLGIEPPAGVRGAVAASGAFLERLIVPGSEGRVPNLGGNDGAHLFQLTTLPITDFRPIVVHAALATGRPPAVPPGPWDAEAHWFGLSRSVDGGLTDDPHRFAPSQLILDHPLRAQGAYALMRAGPLRHRPAHADQLHVDVWLDGREVAVDAGTFRYTAAPPWANALADERAHNVPSLRGRPQAERMGRFFWRRWREARIVAASYGDDGAGILTELELGDVVVQRRVIVRRGTVVVVDQSSGPGFVVRWNLVGAPVVQPSSDDSQTTTLVGDSWTASFQHGGIASITAGNADDPVSGWRSLTYAARDPLTALRLNDHAGRVVSSFAARDAGGPAMPALTNPDLFTIDME